MTVRTAVYIVLYVQRKNDMLNRKCVGGMKHAEKEQFMKKNLGGRKFQGRN